MLNEPFDETNTSRRDLYHVGICDDGINICSALEEMILLYGEKNRIKMDVQVWYTGEEFTQCGLLQKYYPITTGNGTVKLFVLCFLWGGKLPLSVKREMRRYLLSMYAI
mgnify:CR=1 FL=1